MSNINNALNGIDNLGAAVKGVTGGIGTLAGDIASPTLYWDQIQPASWRGVPFVMVAGESSFGRRNAVHEYPNRDRPYVEDLGRGARRYNVTGYLVGDDVIAQRERMIAACEMASTVNAKTGLVGDTLVHPSYGQLTVSLLEPVKITERYQDGRYYELQFSFIEAGARIFPSAASSSTGIASLASSVGVASIASMVSQFAQQLQHGAAVIDGVVATATSWVNSAKKIVQDATTLYKTVAALPGDFGRFVNQAIHGFASGPASQPSTVSVGSLIALGNLARLNVATLGASLVADAANPSNFGNDAVSLAAAVSASVSAPGAAITMLTSLASFPSNAPTLVSPIGAARSGAQNASSDLFRRAAVVAMAQASAEYQPTSANDAADMRALVGGAIEAEMLIAADQGEDDVYVALKALYASVIQDMSAKGASLPSMTAIATSQAIPSLVLAEKLYQDSSRELELVSEANPIHPAFMPISFTGLSK